MNAFAAAVTIVVLVAPSAGARIFETEEQCVARYGRPLEREVIPGGREVRLSFQFSGFMIMVGILDGVCQSELYAKDASQKLNDDEIEMLLKANGRAVGWLDLGDVVKNLPKNSTKKQWATTDRRLIATYDPIHNPDALSIRTLVFDDYIAQKQKGEASKRVDGF